MAFLDFYSKGDILFHRITKAKTFSTLGKAWLQQLLRQPVSTS